jgi:predicted flap endonuclease-1-like 5' DNA nuclease
LPEVNGLGWRNARERAQAEAMVRRGIAALKASGVDVAFGVSPLDMPPMTLVVPEEWATRRNMAQICREAKAYLEGDIRLPRPKAESWQEYALCGLPGVGPERARAMSEEGITPALCHYWPPIGQSPSPQLEPISENDLTEVPGIGPKTAKKIMEAVRSAKSVY